MFGALTWHISGERCIWTLLQVSFSFSRKHSYSANVLFSQDLLILSNRCNVLRQALSQQTDPQQFSGFPHIGEKYISNPLQRLPETYLVHVMLFKEFIPVTALFGVTLTCIKLRPSRNHVLIIK